MNTEPHKLTLLIDPQLKNSLDAACEKMGMSLSDLCALRLNSSITDSKAVIGFLAEMQVKRPDLSVETVLTRIFSAWVATVCAESRVFGETFTIYDIFELEAPADADEFFLWVRKRKEKFFRAIRREQ